MAPRPAGSGPPQPSTADAERSTGTVDEGTGSASAVRAREPGRGDDAGGTAPTSVGPDGTTSVSASGEDPWPRASGVAHADPGGKPAPASGRERATPAGSDAAGAGAGTRGTAGASGAAAAGEGNGTAGAGDGNTVSADGERSTSSGHPGRMSAQLSGSPTVASSASAAAEAVTPGGGGDASSGVAPCRVPAGRTVAAGDGGDGGEAAGAGRSPSEPASTDRSLWATASSAFRSRTGRTLGISAPSRPGPCGQRECAQLPRELPLC